MHKHEELTSEDFYKGIKLQHQRILKKDELVYSFQNDRIYKIVSFSMTARAYTVESFSSTMSPFNVYITLPARFVHRMPFAEPSIKEISS